MDLSVYGGCLTAREVNCVSSLLPLYGLCVFEICQQIIGKSMYMYIPRSPYTTAIARTKLFFPVTISFNDVLHFNINTIYAPWAIQSFTRLCQVNKHIKQNSSKGEVRIYHFWFSVKQEDYIQIGFIVICLPNAIKKDTVCVCVLIKKCFNRSA